MSTIDPSTIDPTKPAQGLPLTANVRANEQATQDNFAAAKADIEALEAQPAGREIQNEGVPLADQTLGAFNIAGNAISVSQNVPQDRYDITANNAVINQVGGGAEVFIGDVGADPVTRELRTFIAGTGATVTQTATEIIIGATGAGGGEVNSAENIGVGLPIALEVNNGTLIPIRSLDASVFEESAGVITISAQTFADWTVAESHYINNNIHFPVSSLPGNGLQQNGTALDVGAGTMITVSSTTVGVTDIAGGAILGRASPGTGAVVPFVGSDLLPNGSPAAGDVVLSWTAGDDLRVIDVASLGAGPNGVTSTLGTVEGELQLGDTPSSGRGIKGLGQGADSLPLISGGTGPGAAPFWAQVNTAGIADTAITFGKLQNVGAETLMLRGLGAGPPSDTKISELTNHAPVSTDYLLLETAAGLLRHSLVSALPGGAGGTYSQTQTYAIAGEITGGMTVVPFSVFLASGETAALSEVRASIESGTSVDVAVRVNGTPVTGYNPVTVTTTRATTDAADATISDGDDIDLVISSAIGTPSDLSVSINIERTR